MSCNNNRRIFSDFDLHSYYIAIDIIYDDQIMPIVINNAYFFHLLMNDNFSEKKYIKLMRRTLDKGGAFHVEDYLLFRELEKHKVDLTLKSSAIFFNKKGKSYVSNFFDENKVLEAELSEEEKKYLIYVLFRQNIFLKVDDETGYLYIP